jgi:hypothetical protein
MNFFQFKQQQKVFYMSIGKVYSPALQGYVYFRADGFHHLIYKETWNQRQRSISDQALRLNCLVYAAEVVAKSPKVSSLRTYDKVSLIELVYELNNGLKIRVIVFSKSGKYKFLSVMPHDKVSALKLKIQKTSPK